MRLLVDVGNSRLKGAVQTADGLQLLPPQPYLDRDIAVALDSWVLPAGVEDCWVACVGHKDLHPTLQAWAQAHTGRPAEFAASAAQACGVTNAYAQPGNLGVDRWLAVIAAHHRGQGGAIVVSAGTAATIDAVDAEGRHVGGLISPGLSTMRKAMLDHTQVRADTDIGGHGFLGNSTDTCVTYGTLNALLGYIEHTVGQLRQDGGDWRLYLTGGDAGQIAPLLREAGEVAQNLVLEGLGILAETSTG